MKAEYLIDKKSKIAVHTGVKSAMSQPEKRLVQLANDATPQNSSEKKIQKQIKVLEKSGKIVEVPAM